MAELNFTYFVVLLAILIVVFIAFYKFEKKFTTVEINGVKIHSEVADNFAKKASGLMFRDKLGKNEGMLFPFDSGGYHKFWMMNVKFPLDFIWIDGNKTIVDVTENAQPCLVSCKSFTSKEKAQYVLEVNAGFVAKNRIKSGEKADFDLE